MCISNRNITITEHLHRAEASKNQVLRQLANNFSLYLAIWTILYMRAIKIRYYHNTQLGCFQFSNNIIVVSNT